VIPEVDVRIGAPNEVSAGGNFSAWVNVSNVYHLGSADYDIIYDPNILNVASVSGGSVGGGIFPVCSWDYSPPETQGRIRIIQYLAAGKWVNGSGYMASVNFSVVGSPCNYSAIQPTPGPFCGGLFNSETGNIPANWISDSVHVDN
jgi:hypothetical protein